MEDIVGKIWQDEDWLRQKYLVEKMSIAQIGCLVGEYGASIHYWMKKYDIPRRALSEAITLGKADPVKRQRHSDIIKDLWDKEDSPYRTESRKEACSLAMTAHWQDEEYRTRVIEKMVKAWTPERRQTTADHQKCLYANGEVDISYRQTEEYRRAHVEGMMKYWEGNDEARAAASERNKRIWAEGYHDEEVKGRSERLRACWTEERRRSQSLAFTGENNPSWNGGTQFAPYPIEFDDEFKQMVRERDDNVCTICRLPEQNGNKLSIHHIDYVKENTTPQNCISLCNACHVVTHHNRDYWQSALSGLLQKRISYLEECDASI